MQTDIMPPVAQQQVMLTCQSLVQDTQMESDLVGLAC